MELWKCEGCEVEIIDVHRNKFLAFVNDFIPKEEDEVEFDSLDLTILKNNPYISKEMELFENEIASIRIISKRLEFQGE